MCRRTRQIIAFFIGDRSDKSCYQLWKRIPEDYKNCISFSDCWSSYEKIFQEDLHGSVGKESGETSHMERWNNTLRQRIGRFVRKTLSFSKFEHFHHLITKLFIYNYNKKIAFNN